MKRLLLSSIIASTLGLTACGGGKSVDDISNATVPLIPQAHLIFDPAAAKVPLPNDLLFNGTIDGTLNVPGEATGNYADPQIALGALDGWSTTEPITIDVDLPKKDSNGKDIDLGISVASVKQEGALRVFEATASGPLSSDASCKGNTPLTACKVGNELKYGVDFVTNVAGSKIAIVPIKPLKPGSSYLYVVTNKVQDTDNRPIGSSATYNVLKLDVKKNPLGTEQQRLLQTVVNSYEQGVNAKGVDPASIIYSGLYTTQSVPNVIEVTKAKMAQDFAAGLQPGGTFGPYAPRLVSPPQPVMNGSDIKTAEDQIDPDKKLPSLFQAVLGNALVYKAKVRLPLYSQCSSVSCIKDGKPLVDGRWQAHGDSPIAVLNAVRTGKLSQADFAKQAVAQGIKNPAAALTNPALLVGKKFNFADGKPVDPVKHLTKFNPLPQIRGYETVDVQITIPKLSADQRPAKGFPVTIGMHGLGASKEMVLIYSGLFATINDNNAKVPLDSPLATIAIDMPLHGERSFAAGDDKNYLVTATTKGSASSLNLEGNFDRGTPLTFVNVASPLSIRDNFRQGVMDNLAVRLMVPVFAKALAQLPAPVAARINPEGVTAQGLSLGAIVTTDFAVAANTGITNPATGKKSTTNPYVVNGVSLVAPSGGLAAAFAGSPTYGHLLYNNVIKQPRFLEGVKAANKQNFEVGTPQYKAIVNAAYQQFIPQLGFAVQTAIDSIDPVNYAAMLKATNTPVHLIEVVGDGNMYKQDQVLPNRFNGLPIDRDGKTVLPMKGFPLSGTEPLIQNLGLACVDKTTEGSGAVRFTRGTHTSLVNPANPDDPNDLTFGVVTLEMQTEIAKFAESSHARKSEIFIDAKDSSKVFVKACGQ
ncbi:MAG: VolA/Pla-1 family phospholipase [Parashewanella sp.]